MTPGEHEPGLSKQETGQLEISRHPISRRIGAVVALAAAVGSFASVAIHGVKGLEGEPNLETATAKLAEPDYAPAELNSIGKNQAVARDNMTEEYLDEGHITGLFAPNPETRAVLHKSFEEKSSENSKSTPKLREVAYLQDQQLFKPEWKNYITVYPFSVYNTTRHPIDLPFINYAIRATKSWLIATERDENGFILGGHTKADAAPQAVPHYMVLTHKIPEELREKLPKSDGVTSWQYDRTESFVKDSGPTNAPFEPWIVGTEVCQSLIDIDYQSTIRGQEEQQQAMQDFIADFNEDAANNMDLTAQESVCNSLGRVLEATYIDGQPGIDKLKASLDSDASWLDYEIFESQIPSFIRLAASIRGGELDVVTARKDVSPTIRYYRQNKTSLASG